MRKVGRRNNATHLFGIHHAKNGRSHCYVGPLLSHFSRHSPVKSGLPLPWTVLAVMLRGPLSHPICRQGDYSLWVLPRDVSSHSMADSRDKLHLIRHHPIHAQNFTIRSHSTAQVPCSCLASTCSDVSSRPPCFEFFVMEGHMSTISQVKSSFFVPDVSTRPGSPFFKNWPDVTPRPPCTVLPGCHFYGTLRI